MFHAIQMLTKSGLFIEGFTRNISQLPPPRIECFT
jgi:hypothetical protein